MVLTSWFVARTEDIAVNAHEMMQGVVTRLEFRFVAKPNTVDSSIFQLSPDILPTLLLPGYRDAVSRDISKLGMDGSDATWTSAEVICLAATGPGRAGVHRFPEAGHAAPAFSPCASDIGPAFVERPVEP